MPKSALLFVFVANLLLICLASARLPDTEAVNAAYYEAVGTIYGEEEQDCAEDSDAVAAAFFALLLEAEPLVEDRLELVNAVKDAMAGALHECDGPAEFKTTSTLLFLGQVVERYPQEDEIQKLAIAYEANRSFPWKNLQRKLVARGDLWAFEQGLNRLNWSPEPYSETKTFESALANFVSQVALEQLEEVLKQADTLGFSAVVAAGVKRIKVDPQLADLRTNYKMPQNLLAYEVRALAAQYDLATLAPPALEPWTVGGPGQSNEAFAKLKQMVEGTPKVNHDHPEFRERMQRFDALIEEYPNYGRIYEIKASYLFSAGLKEEALLTQTSVVRMHPNSANSGYYSDQARYWMALGYGGQALVEAQRALRISVSGYDKNTLLIYCAVAVAESLKDDGLVPESWDATIADRLGKMEEQNEAYMVNSRTLYVDAIRFWDKRGDFPRARAALARFKKFGSREVVAAHDGSFAAWEKRWEETSEPAFYYGLPEAPKPYGLDLELAFHEGDLPRAWTIFSKWSDAEPKAVSPRLYGAAAFLDLGAPYLALALIEEAKPLKATIEESQLLARIKAGSSARLGESVAAALEYAKSGDGEDLSTYWLQVFVEANQASVYSRISNRALEVLSDDDRDAELLAWAWKTYAMTAPASAVDTWSDALSAGGGVPGEPLSLSSELTKAQRPLQVAWSDNQAVQGDASNRDWLMFAKLAEADGREADAAFFAACWLMGLSPNEDYDSTEEAQARSMVVAYRDGASPEEDFASVLLRNPCNTEVMVRAYEAARERRDLYEAAEYLRQIFMAYGEDRIDLLEACNVATSAADWELLLTVSQTALARQPSDESRGWYNLALIACNKIDTATTIRSQMYDGTLRAVAREISGWVPFVDGYGYTLSKLSEGEYVELHAAIKDAKSLREARINAEKEAEVNRYYKNKVIEMTAAVNTHLMNASPSVRTHVAFQLGEIDEAAYKAKLASPDDRTFGQIFSILSRWKDGSQVNLRGDDLADVQSIMYDQGQHLRFRVMAYAMLRSSNVALAPQPLRASDPLLIERSSVGALAEMRAGRLTLVNGAEELLRFLGGTSRVTFPNKKTVRTIGLPTPPAVMRICIAPDLAEQRLSGLTSANFEKQMQDLGLAGLRPVLDRALSTLRSDLAAAGAEPQDRWAALKRGGSRVWRLGESFYLTDGTFADDSMALLQPHLGKYPVDAFVAAFESRLLPIASVDSYIPRLPADAQEVIKIGRQASRNAYNESERKTGVRYSGDDARKDVENLLLSFPPGSEMFPYVKDVLAKGVQPSRVKAEVAAEKSRRLAAIAAAELREANLKLYDESMAKGDMAGLEKAALQLGGQHYVKWALKAPSARLDQLVQARAYAAYGSDRDALTAEINRRLNAQWKTATTSSYTPNSRSSGSSGTSWSSFSASMSAKSDAAYQYQKARDMKNFVVRFRSDGSYSTH